MQWLNKLNTYDLRWRKQNRGQINAVKNFLSDLTTGIIIVSLTFFAGIYALEVVTSKLFTQPGMAQELLVKILKDTDTASYYYKTIMQYSSVWAIAALLLFWELVHQEKKPKSRRKSK